MRPKTERLCLGTILGLTILFHALTVGGQSLFVDEIAELQHARGSLTEVAFRADSMPPTFNLLVAGWGRLFGEGASARLISVGFSLGAAILVWRIGRRLGDACRVDAPTAGIISTATFAALPLQLYYAQLIRGYALTNFAAALAILAFLRATANDRPRDWATFAAAGTFGMWCHYYFAITLVLLLACLACRRGWAIGSKPLLAGIAIAIGCLPLLPFLKEDFGYQRDLREPRPLSLAAIGYTGMSFFSGYTLGPSKAELHQLTGSEAIKQAAPWVMALCVALTPLIAWGAAGLRRGRWLIPMMLLTLGPIALVGLLGAATGITYNPRFVAWCVVPIAAWLGIGITQGITHSPVRRWPTIVCCLALTTITTIAIAQRHLSPRYQTEDLQAATSWVSSNVPSGAGVFVISDYLTPQVEFLAEIANKPIPRIDALPRPGEVDNVVRDGQLAAEAIEHLTSKAVGGEFWLVSCRAFHTDPDGLLLSAIEQVARLETAAEFAGVRVYRGELRGE